jgi:hypothetical protein
MKIAIMQPYFFPYLGYFQLINAVDQWIAFDNIQFIDKGWINRNRILHPNHSKEWQFITIPLSKRGQFDKICDISIKSDIDWKSEILGKLTVYKNFKAPYYNEVVGLVEKVFETKEENLSKFIVRSLRLICDYLDIKTKIQIQSEMSLDLPITKHPGQWALNISEKLGASEYINPMGGYNIFDEKEFMKKKIKLTFLKPNLSHYKQSWFKDFKAGLSILDLLMFIDVDYLSDMINNDYKFFKRSELFDD